MRGAPSTRRRCAGRWLRAGAGPPCAAALLALGAGARADETRALEAVLADTVPAVADAVAGLAGRPFRWPVSWRVADAETIAADVRASLARDFPPARLRDVARAEAALGLLPPGTDLEAAHGRLCAAGVAAYYDARARTLVVPASTDPDPARVARLLAHELTHAGQDQHHDLHGLTRPDRWDDDAAWAHAALCEGEAVWVAEAFARRPAAVTPEALRAVAATFRARPGPPEVPLVLRETLVFPYAEGGRFVAAALERGGPAAVARCFQDLPATTEQILHPERFFDARDEPTPLPAPDLLAALGPGWRLLEQNVLGEHRLGVLLRSALDAAVAARAAAGWDGFRFAVWGDGGGACVLAFDSAWDTEADAAEFEVAWTAARAARDPRALWPGGARALLESPPAPPRLERRGTRVRGLEGAPPGRVAACWQVLGGAR